MTTASLRAIQQHLAALPSELYEVGVYRSEVQRMQLRTWDRTHLDQSLGWLAARNALDGAAIYLRPHGHHRYSLVDDLKPETLQRMKAEGFSPALVVETSPNNLQAWLDHGQVLEPKLSTRAARYLAETFGGDVKAADWRHFGRLAGFTNQKPKYQQSDGTFPWVKVIACEPGLVYTCAPQTVERIRAALAAEGQRIPAFAGRAAGPSKSIADFHADPRYGGDLSRADFAYALYAVSRQLPREEITAALHQRDLSKKGNAFAQDAYVGRTLERAAKELNTAALGNVHEIER
jgi:hypothetical protein